MEKIRYLLTSFIEKILEYVIGLPKEILRF